MKKTYRADQVGSLLRPESLKQAHIASERGELPLEKLREIEDDAIEGVLAMQREAGLDVLTDGEFRRGFWTGEFTNVVDGYVPGTPPVTLHWHGAEEGATANPLATVQAPTGRVIGEKLSARGRFTDVEAGYLARHARAPFKITMPAASYLVSRGYKPGVTDKVYENRAAVLKDVAALLRAEIKALIAEGVPYIQLDNPHYPDYLMASIGDQWRALGVDPDQALAEDVEADNACLEGLDREGVTIAMHFCRGNGGSAGWHSEGSYEPIAEQTFGRLAVDRFLLEFDTDRAGGFEPLRFVPKDKQVVLGLVTTKVGSLETEDGLRRRIDEASKFVPGGNLALSPQCGFASVLEGNRLTQDDQRRKLELVATTAHKVWGAA